MKVKVISIFIISDIQKVFSVPFLSWWRINLPWSPDIFWRYSKSRNVVLINQEDLQNLEKLQGVIKGCGESLSLRVCKENFCQWIKRTLRFSQHPKQNTPFVLLSSCVTKFAEDGVYLCPQVLWDFQHRSAWLIDRKRPIHVLLLVRAENGLLRVLRLKIKPIIF